MKKVTVLIGMVAMLVVSSMSSGALINGHEWVKATVGLSQDGHTDATTNTLPVNGDPAWYSTPDVMWAWNPGPTADKWFAYAGDGGLDTAGTASWNPAWYSITYWNNGGIPMLQTTLEGLQPGGVYNVYAVYKSIPWTSNLAGVSAALEGQPLVAHTDVDGTDLGTMGNPSGLPFYEALVGQTTAVGGEITIDIHGYGGERTYYEGLTYELVPEPATLALLSLGMGVVLRKRSRK
jgi:hypothetical protein